MKKVFISFCLLIGNLFIYSQVLHDFTGKPYMITQYSKVVDGSAFFKEVFLMGDVIMKNGDVFKNQSLRLNLLDNLLNYQDEKKQEMIATIPIKEVSLMDATKGVQYNFIHSDFIPGNIMPERGWYEKLQKGKATLIKKYKKEITESPVYGSANNELTISTQIRYYLLVDTEWKIIKKQKNIIEMLGNKKSELQKYIKDQKLDEETELNFNEIVRYYNSIQ
jgi:hypothetical protein